MDDDNVFFAAPPAGDDAPIVLGPPPTDDPFAAPTDAFAAPSDAFAAPPPAGDYSFEAAPVHVGDVNENSDLAAVDSDAPVVPSEPSPMQIWNEKWMETLAARKEEENAAKAAFLEKAKQDLENFQKEREMKRESALAKNREDEQAKLEAIEADLENDNSWQRVCKLVDLSSDNTASLDTKRMRDVMILLKNEPGKAQTLSA